MTSGHELNLRIPQARKLRCPICKSSHRLVASVLVEHGMVNYTSDFSESMGWWLARGVPGTNHTQGLFLACIACRVFGTEDFFDPRAKPPKLYHNRNGFYVKIRLPYVMGAGLFEKIELNCYIRTTNAAGLNFIGMLKVAAVKTVAELPEFLTWELTEAAAYAKALLKDLQAAARRKKKKKRKKS